VLRAEGIGPFVPIARVQAGSGTGMLYVDATGAPSSRLRYAIRRESVDKRYEWTGTERIWWAEGRAITVRISAANPVTNGVLRFAISGAVQGALDVRLYDLAGREVWRVKPTATGTGEDSLTLPLADAPAPLPPGLYLLRITDDAGVSAPTAKLVILH